MKINDNIQLYHGDCLIESDNIKSGSVDLILCDPPYGTMNGFNSINWDFAIDPKELFKVANRILRKNGKLILFSQEPYTSRLITESIANIPLSYKAIWEKDSFANALGCNKNMVSFFEDILIFSKKDDTDLMHPLRGYFKQILYYIGLNSKQVNSVLKHRKAEHTFYIDSTQFELCTEQTYNELTDKFNLKDMNGYINFNELKEIDNQFKQEYKSTFNLWQDGKYKSNILTYKKDYTHLHQTQKPVLLLEDLIKTYSHNNDMIVDLTMGSCSTGIAAINTDRRFIGIEMNDHYYKVSTDRVNNRLLELITLN